MEQLLIYGGLGLAFLLGLYAMTLGNSNQNNTRNNTESNSITRNTSSNPEDTSNHLPKADGGNSITRRDNSSEASDQGELPVTNSPSEPSGPDLPETEQELGSALTGLQALMPQGQGGQPLVVINNLQQQQQQQMGPGQSFLPPALNSYRNPFMPVPPMPPGQGPIPPITPPGGGQPEIPEKVPEPAPLLKLIKKLEKPVKAFLMMSKAGDKDIEKIITKTKKLERKKNEERRMLEKLDSKMREAEKELEKIDSGQLDDSKLDKVKIDLFSKLDKIETKVEDLEDNQSKYEKLLSNEDKELVQILKQNSKALKDVDLIIAALDKVAKSTEMVSPLIETSEEKEKIKLSTQEIREIEKFLEKMLGEEKKLTEELEALKQVERETERIEEKELDDIKKLLEDDNRFKSKLKKAEQHGNLEKAEYNRTIENLNKLAKILRKLGKEVEEEEKLEKSIISDADDGEKTIEAEEKQDEKDLDKAEKDTDEAAKKADKTSGKAQKGQEWNEILKNPGKYIEPKDSLNIKSNELEKYRIPNSGWCGHNYANYSTPTQGFKFHITGRPKDSYQVVKELIPILQANNISHKIIKSKKWMEERIDDKDDVQAMKLITIYPKDSFDGAEKVFKLGHESHNKKLFFSNLDHTKDILKIIAREADDRILKGGPKLEGERKKYGETLKVKEYRCGDSRIHVTYSNVSSDEDRLIELNGQKSNHFLKYIAQTDDEGNLIKEETGDLGIFTSYLPDESKFRKTNGYFLGHLLAESKAESVKNSIIQNNYNDIHLGLDGKVAGAYYLPPPEGVEECKKIASSF